MSTTTLALLSPSRLGDVLRRHREARGRSLEQVAEASSVSATTLAAVERGDATLADHQLDAVLAAYGAEPSDLLASRSQVVVDLDRGELLVAERSALLGRRAPTADEILAAYLSLLYALRSAEPGTPLVLRRDDLAVLARSLRLAEPEVEARLTGLMRQPTPELTARHRRWRRKLVVPAVGAAVVAVVVGAVLVVGGDDAPAPAPEPTSTVATRPAPVEAPVDTDVSLAPPQVLERNP